MKRTFYFMLVPATALLVSCGGSDTVEETKTDTSVIVNNTNTVTDTVVQTVTQPVDTAAIIAAYEAAYAKTKSTDKKPEYKEKKNKKVAVYPEPEIESKAPDEKAMADVSGYNYKPDKYATYPGGKKAFDDYFYKNFEYPDNALDNNIQGTIYAEIFIDEKGMIDRVEFPGHKLGYGLEDEARRVIMGAKQLDPAIKNGAPAKQRYILPIRVLIKE